MISPDYADDFIEGQSERQFLRELHCPPEEAPEDYLTQEQEWYEAQVAEFHADVEAEDAWEEEEDERLWDNIERQG